MNTNKNDGKPQPLLIHLSTDQGKACLPPFHPLISTLISTAVLYATTLLVSSTEVERDLQVLNSAFTSNVKSKVTEAIRDLRPVTCDL